MAVNYQDDTHITGRGDLPTVAQWLRTKMYGVDVREALAQAIELADESVKQNEALANRFKEQITAAETANAAAQQLVNDADKKADNLVASANEAAKTTIDAANAGAKIVTDAANQASKDITEYREAAENLLHEINETGGTGNILDPAVKTAVTNIANGEGVK